MARISIDSPYMLLIVDLRLKQCKSVPKAQDALFGIDLLNVPRSDILAVAHMDYSARIQTVHRETNPCSHAVLQAFKAKTGCPVIVNTSFNVRDEPIVCTPAAAFRCFMGTDIDCFTIGNSFLRKEAQEPTLKIKEYEGSFNLD